MKTEGLALYLAVFEQQNLTSALSQFLRLAPKSSPGLDCDIFEIETFGASVVQEKDVVPSC